MSPRDRAAASDGFAPGVPDVVGGRAHLIATVALLAVGVASALLTASGSSLLAPVVTSVGDTSLTVARVDIGIAALVPLALGVVAHLLASRRPVRLAAIVWAERSLSASITVFLLAQLTGIRELGALVAIYALTSALVLFAVLHERRDRALGRMPGVFGAMVGIVPLGLIAWYQVAPAVVIGPDAGPAVWVRALTLVMLALFVVAGWHRWRSPGDTRAALALDVVARSVFALTGAAAVAAGWGLG
ncbi:hypothetical protein BH11ACT3_BH11ACT3_12190 [soil metagenome]